jgi:predicted esterase
MSADRMSPPRTGTAADVPYFALPPTAVDARPAGDTRLIVAWHGFGPPSTPAALAAALPMTGVPTWRVYLRAPVPAGALPPAGLGGDTAVESYGAAVEEAVERFPEALAEIRRELGLEPGPVGLAGFSAGATVALLVLASGTVPVSAAACVSPIVAPSRTMTEIGRQTGRPYAWTGPSRVVADRLDLAARADDLARAGAPVLLVGGSRDQLVRVGELTRLRDLLVERGATAETATLRMSHALAAEPGVEALPPIPEAVSVDGTLTDWFREHLAVVGDPATEATPPAAAPLRLEETREDGGRRNSPIGVGGPPG